GVDGGLARGDESGIDDLQAFDAVFGASPLQRFELVNLALVVRDDELAGAHVRNAVLRAELVQVVTAFDAEARLERARRMIQTGVNDAAVVRAGVLAGARVALEDDDRAAPLRDRARRCQP